MAFDLATAETTSIVGMADKLGFYSSADDEWKAITREDLVPALFACPIGETSYAWDLAAPQAHESQPGTSPKLRLTIISSENTNAPWYDDEAPDATPKNAIWKLGFGFEAGGTLQAAVTVPCFNISGESLFWAAEHAEWVAECHLGEVCWPAVGETPGVSTRFISLEALRTSKRLFGSIRAKRLSVYPDFIDGENAGQLLELTFGNLVNGKGKLALDGLTIVLGGAASWNYDGSFTPAPIADAAATNGTIYLSTDTGRLTHRVDGSTFYEMKPR